MIGPPKSEGAAQDPTPAQRPVENGLTSPEHSAPAAGDQGALPAPLVPADADLRDFPYLPLDVRRLRDSRFAAVVEGEAFRAGVLLWAAAWHQLPAGTLADDDLELAQLAGFGRMVAAWREVREGALYGWRRCSDGRLHHPVVAEKANEAWATKRRYAYHREADRLRKANAKREKDGLEPLPVPTLEEWLQRSAGIPADGQRNSGGTPTESAGTAGGIPAVKESDGKGESPPPPSSSEGRPRAGRSTRLPEGWSPGFDSLSFALAEGLSADQHRRQLASFLDYWPAQPGGKGRKVDWDLTLKNWLRRAADNLSVNGRPSTSAPAAPQGQSPLATFFAGAAAASGRLRDAE